MAIRQTIHVLKNSDIVNRPLPASLLAGEPIVNTADGIMYFSGVTSSTSEWTPAGTGATELTFFEVGSNLYDLRLRNQITEYQGVSGSGLIGKFLSGTSTGFVLADITDINGISGLTYDPLTNTITLIDSSGDQYPVTITAFSGLSINGDLDVTGSSTFNDVTISGTGLYTLVATGSNVNEIVNYQTLTGFSQANDVYVTGSTLTPADDNSNLQSSQLLYYNVPIGGPYSIDTENTYTTGGTYDNNTKLISFLRNDGTSGYTVDLTNIDTNDTYVTGGTDNSATVNTPVASIGLLYNQDVTPGTNTLPYSNVFLTGFTYSNNTFELKDNSGNTFTQVVNDFTGLTINGDLTVTGNTSVQSLTGSTISLPSLGSNRVVYTTSGGTLTTESNFTYDEGTDTLGVTNIEAAGSVVIQGNLTVFGSAISAFTTELYVEDPNITLNYNPTGNTTTTSVNSGFVIQDGNGVNGGNVNFDIVRMQNLTGLTATEIPDVTEYTSLTGFDNRGWITQLNDIVIRSTDVSDGGSAGDITGVRVLAEFDVLDGGSY
jgi:hypothetical protein